MNKTDHGQALINSIEERADRNYTRAVNAEEALRKIREEIPSPPKLPLSVNILQIIDNYFNG